MVDREREIRDVLHAGARGYVLKSEADEQIVQAVEALAHHQAFFSDPVSLVKQLRSGDLTAVSVPDPRKARDAVGAGAQVPEPAALDEEAWARAKVIERLDGPTEFDRVRVHPGYLPRKPKWMKQARYRKLRKKLVTQRPAENTWSG
jgi:hypothetical protein